MDSVTTVTTAKTQQLHFLLLPFMAQGHMIPMAGLAKLLASRGITVTIVTTPVNAARFESSLRSAMDGLGLQINIVGLPFPCSEAGLPHGCENMDMLPSMADIPFLNKAAAMMEPQVASLLEKMSIKPACVISDYLLPYTNNVAKKFGVPRISFVVFSCFSLLCVRCAKLHQDEIDRRASSDHEYFTLPGFPTQIDFTKEQFPTPHRCPIEDVRVLYEECEKADSESYGDIVNSFEELEPDYFSELNKSRRGKVWCVGPFSLTNLHNSISISHHSLDWLDNQEPKAVLYVCFGSQFLPSTQRLIEVALALEASRKPFIWAIRDAEAIEDLYRWVMEQGFEDRVAGKGILVRGWVPQVSILSHPSVGGFLTHCGWNSILEAISVGIPLVTYPFMADHFCNEKLVVEVLRIGVRVGVERPMYIDGNDKVMKAGMNRVDVEKAVRLTMEESEEGDARRNRAKKVAEMARRAVESDGSSYRNVDMLIEDISKLQEEC